jgi:hypothetical protein
VFAGLAEMAVDTRESQEENHVRSYAGLATFRISLKTNLSKRNQETGENSPHC